jgi:hypothetical protein
MSASALVQVLGGYPIVLIQAFWLRGRLVAAASQNVLKFFKVNS